MTRVYWKLAVSLFVLLHLGLFQPSAALLANDSVAKQIEALDADDSAARDAAEEALIAAGPEVVDPLGQAVFKGSLERRFRAVRVLSQLLRSDNEQTAQKAKAALEAASAKGEPAVIRQAEASLSYLRRLELMRKLADRFPVQDTAEADPKPVQLIERPLLRFQDRQRDNADGTLWGYSTGGRPKAVVATFPFSGEIWYSDAVALGDTPIAVKEVDGNAELNWSPSRASEAFREFPEAPKPAGTAEERLAQINALVSRMAARQDTPKGKRPYDLSLLNRPLLRYADESSGIVDGGLFAFVHETNPEVLVLIEAQGEPDSAVWRYRLARHTSKALFVEIDDAEVWASPAPTDFLNGGDRAYWVVRRTLPE
jgi:hypothetical protein